MIIEDGTGTGRKAKINLENELEVRAIESSVTLHAVDEGRGFNINTGILTLTDATADTAVLYIKNTDLNDMVITSATISSGFSTAGVDETIVLNQVGAFTSASDIIANGATGAAVNRNSGKTSRTFNGVIKTGGTGRSFTDEIIGQRTMGVFTTPVQIPLTTIIPVGGEVGITVNPPASNTSMRFMLSVNFHIKETL